jgi:hypothetical protein
VRKKSLLRQPLPIATDDASADISVDFLPPLAALDDDDDTNADRVKDTQPNATGRWTPEEDAKLTSAVSNTCEKKHGKEHRIDYVAVAALVPGRTNIHRRLQ